MSDIARIKSRIALVGANCSPFLISVPLKKCFKASTEKYAFPTRKNILDFCNFY